MIIRRTGSVGELHALDPEPGVWWYVPTDAALVLGSRQSPEMVDAARCASLGLAIVRRRSGGGAVLIEPDAMLWVDLVVPPGVAPDDVRGSMVWAGELWRAALTPHVAGRELAINDGPMLTTPWSPLVCFAGYGPGELALGGHKLLGLSQRRSRRGVRIQGMVYLVPPAIDVATLFRGARPGEPLPAVATLERSAAAAVVAALDGGIWG